MIVKISKTYSVEYEGDQYKENALNSLQVIAREMEGCGSTGFCKVTEITKKHPSATYAIEVVSDSEA